MAVERGETRRLLLEAPVRHGKTWMCAKRFPLWYMARNPGHDAMLGCYGGDLAADAGRELRDLALQKKHLDIFPEVEAVWEFAAGGQLGVANSEVSFWAPAPAGRSWAVRLQSWNLG